MPDPKSYMMRYVSFLEAETYMHPFNLRGMAVRTIKRYFRIVPKKEIATIMFVDMASSTLIKDDIEEAWQENFFYLHKKVKRITKLCHGKISKTIGDCVMCYFTGINQADNALRCCFALLEHFMLAKRDMDLDMWDSYMFRFSIKIGMAIGPVSYLYRNDIFGQSVDLASRLQGLCNEGEACIDNNIFDAIQENEIYLSLESALSETQFPDVKSFRGVEIKRMSVGYDFWVDRQLHHRYYIFAPNLIEKDPNHRANIENSTNE